MRYHIDTITVWDAMKLDGECFLCALKRKTEIGEVEHYLADLGFALERAEEAFAVQLDGVPHGDRVDMVLQSGHLRAYILPIW